MTATHQVAINEMHALLVQAVAASEFPDLRVDYESNPDGEPSPREDFVRINITHLDAGQASFPRGARKRKWDRIGLLMVQCFAAPGLEFSTRALQLATIANNAYEGKATPSHVWFRNVRIVKVGIEERGFYQYNVVAQFTYNTIR